MSDDSERTSGDAEGFDPAGTDALDDLLESIESTDGPVSGADGAELSEGISLGRRLVGLLAIVLGVLGCLIALYLAFSSLRLLFGASDTTDEAMAPVAAAFDRLEDRIDQADDLVDRQGIESDRVPVLRATVDGLVDITTTAERSFDAIDDHPLYSRLPADLGPLGDALGRYSTSAASIDELLGSTATVRTASAAAIADELDGMQSSVTGTRRELDDAVGSLRSWLRIGGLLGLLASLSVLWSQTVLARRGWRGFRNRPV